MHKLENRIEQLRSHLVEKAMIEGSLSDERLVQLSQKLDKYIVEYQKSRLSGFRRGCRKAEGFPGPAFMGRKSDWL